MHLIIYPLPLQASLVRWRQLFPRFLRGPLWTPLQVSSLSRQVANQQGLLDNIGGANEVELVEFLRTCAQGVNPSGSVQVLPRTPLRDGSGRVRGRVPLGAVGGGLVAGLARLVLILLLLELHASLPPRVAPAPPVPGRACPAWPGLSPWVGRPPLSCACRTGCSCTRPWWCPAPMATCCWRWKNGVAVVLPSGAGLGSVVRPGPFKL